MSAWKSIKGFRSLYLISKKGNVKSLLFNKEKILKHGDNGSGYLFVYLYLHNKIHRFYIHRLVANAFIPNPDNKPQVNHKDGNKHNNMVGNLEWVTQSENMKHSVINNLHRHGILEGAENGNAILTKNDVLDIIDLYNSKMISQENIGILYNINQTHVSRIVNRKSWKYLYKRVNRK